MIRCYHFTDPTMEADLVDDKGKVKRYKDVFVNAASTEAAVEKAKLDDAYVVAYVHNLSKDWQVPHG